MVSRNLWFVLKLENIWNLGLIEHVSIFDSCFSVENCVLSLGFFLDVSWNCSVFWTTNSRVLKNFKCWLFRFGFGVFLSQNSFISWNESNCLISLHHRELIIEIVVFYQFIVLWVVLGNDCMLNTKSQLFTSASQTFWTLSYVIIGIHRCIIDFSVFLYVRILHKFFVSSMI